MVRRRKATESPAADVWHRLESFTNTLYEEMDKLAKKAPASRLSDLATERVNRPIREAKELMGQHDTYIADLAEFVPAGENPEVRDAVLVLGEIRAALERLDETFKLTRQIRGF